MKKILSLVVVLVAVGFFVLKQYNQGCVCNLDNVNLTEYVVIVTGGNTGIGYETSKALALKGATVIIASHDLDRITQSIQDIKNETNTQTLKLEAMLLDLSSLESVRNFVQQFKQKQLPLHVLVNNAGVWMGDSRQVTKDGFEKTFGVNHLGHFLLTNLLLDEIKQVKGRVVTVSSGLHLRGDIDFENLQSEKNYSHMSAYANSKLANVLFSNELARRLKDTGVSCFSLHPGVITTNLHREQQKTNPLLMWLFYEIFWGGVGKSQFHGAQTTITAAVSPNFNGKTGLYLTECDISPPNPVALDEPIAKQLWEISEKLVGL